MLRRFFTLSLSLAGTGAAVPLVAVNPVKTTSGTVQGIAAGWPKDGGVSAYLGIPYAVPPVGKLRFTAPQAFKGNGTLPASEFGNDCMQPYEDAGAMRDLDAAVTNYGIGMGGDPGHKYDEDCLTINVWTKPQSGEKAKAVMVWIYGGAFGAGTSNAPFYNGGRLAADQDVVVVSLNYRLNVFGFPNAPGLPDLNLGLLDQRLAIEWVRDNIASFGGDPKRITIFGESAGGASVDYYSYAWTKDPIVNGFIAQSGTISMPGKTDIDRAQWFKVSESLGCGGASAAEKTVDCMRGKTQLEIMRAVGKLSPAGALASLTIFGPTRDDKIIFADYPARAKVGNFIKRPILVGSTGHESGLVTGLAMGSLRGYAAKGDATANLAKMAIDVIDSIRNSAFVALISGFSDTMFSCGGGPAAQARRDQGISAWRYVFLSEFENQAIYPNIGAYHSSDCPVVFGAVELRKDAKPNTPEQDKFIRNVMTAWASFAKDPDNGLAKLGWPVYDASKNTLVQLGYQNRSEPTFAPVAQNDQFCSPANLGKSSKTSKF